MKVVHIYQDLETYRTLKKYADESGLLKKVKFEISGDDFREADRSSFVKVLEPQFEGQTKQNWNKEVTSSVSQAKAKCLKLFRRKS